MTTEETNNNTIRIENPSPKLLKFINEYQKKKTEHMEEIRQKFIDKLRVNPDLQDSDLYILVRSRVTGALTRVRYGGTNAHGTHLWYTETGTVPVTENDINNDISERNFNGIYDPEDRDKYLTVEDIFSDMDPLTKYYKFLLHNIAHRDTYKTEYGWRVQGRILKRSLDEILSKFRRSLDCTIRYNDEDSYLITFSIHTIRKTGTAK